MKKMKKSQIALGLMALTIVSAFGISSATLAAGTENSTSTTAKIASHLRINKGIKNPKNNANFAANQATMKAKQVAIQAALKANDYNAWVTAVGANAPILQKINATNFSTYVQIYNLRQQEQVLETQLGLTKGMGMGGHFELGDK